jgi:hypothetical protein
MQSAAHMTGFDVGCGRLLAARIAWAPAPRDAVAPIVLIGFIVALPRERLDRLWQSRGKMWRNSDGRASDHLLKGFRITPAQSRVRGEGILNPKNREVDGRYAALLEEADAQVQEVLRLLQGSWATFASDLQSADTTVGAPLVEAKR